MFALFLIELAVSEKLTQTEHIVFYLLTGFLSNFISLFFSPFSISVGASGAIMGLYGVSLSMLFFKEFKKIKSAVFIGLLSIVLPTILLGFFTNANNAAHIGGLLSGFLGGLLYFFSKKELKKEFEV
ncbi:Uncharacterized membrane protein (Homolog of Drosophila rhomboid) (fragment) [uncultured Paludibacter sp.]